MKDHKGERWTSNKRLWTGLVSIVLCIGILYPLWGYNVFSGTNSVNKKLQPVMFVEKTGSCDNEVMFGLEADAGWWLCWPKDFKASKDTCKVLSWGIQDHYSFDEAVIKAGCDVHGFDPSSIGLTSSNRYTEIGGVYHTHGLGRYDKTYGPGEAPFNWPGINYLRGSNSIPWTLRSITTTLKDVLGEPRTPVMNKQTLTVLKIDVEGAEWDVIDQLVQGEWDQLLVELHFPPNEYNLAETQSGKGFVITRLPQSGIYNLMFPPRLDYIELWEQIMKVAEMWK